MNDMEVTAELKKMVDFIRQEAEEKAREIQVKADEEHNIEKAKIVRQESMNIEALYEKKMKQAGAQWKINQSNYSNKCRLQILQSREEQLQAVVADCKNKLSQIPTNQQRYSKLLALLLFQGAVKLQDSKVIVQCRPKDRQLVEKEVVPAVSREYQQKNHDHKLEVLVQDSLPDKSCGGVIVLSSDGKISCDNTLEARLQLASEKLLPAIRVLLFGVPEYRRFFD